MKRPRNIELAASYDLLEYICALEELVLRLYDYHNDDYYLPEDLKWIEEIDQASRPRFEPLETFPDGYNEQ